MGEDEKKDYRLHLINTIDNAINNGISVYDLDVVNKKAIRHNYINKQVVIDKIKEYDKKMEEDAGHPNWVVTDRIVINVLQELLGGERNELER